MVRFIIFAAFLVYSQTSSADLSVKRIVTGLRTSTSYHEFMEKFVTPTIAEAREYYKKNPEIFCFSLTEISNEDLIYLKEVLDAVKSEIPCVLTATERIDGFYRNYKDASTQMIAKKKMKSKEFNALLSNPIKLESSKLILDKAYSLPTEKQLPSKVINLTFDDGPHPENTGKVLDVLATYGVKANFFVLGKNAKQYPHLIKETAEAGHSIGGHSMTHASLNKLSFERATKEIMGVFDVVEKILGGVDPFFRFPYGARTKPLRDYLAQNNISDFFWNVDTLDWKYKDPKVLLNYALTQTTGTGRGIVLFHDIQPQTVAMLPEYLEALAEKGYKTVVYEPK